MSETIISFRDALNEALHEEMQRDPTRHRAG